MKIASASRFRFPLLIVATAIALVACIDTNPTEPGTLRVTNKPLLTSMNCVATVATNSVSCSPDAAGLGASVIGGQNVNLKVTTSNVSYD